nr:sugar ABC transporter permease [Clostridia bacterium]
MTTLPRSDRKPQRWYRHPRMRRKGLVMLTFLLPGAIYYAVFRYAPMWGTLIAFQDYNPFVGFFSSKWVGMKHFNTFFQSLFFWRLIVNTLALSAYSLVFGFPVPILFALMLNEVRFP